MKDSSAILEINTKNILHNYKALSRIASNSISGATIKANAYGLGDIKVFNILYNNGCRHFFVATIEEGLSLRKKYKKNKSNIYILNGVNKNQIKLVQQKNLIPIINSVDELNFFNRKFLNSKNKIKVGVHIDSGINRLGIQTNNLKDYKTDNIKICLLLSHLASSDEKNNKYNRTKNVHIAIKESVNLANQFILFLLSIRSNFRASTGFFPHKASSEAFIISTAVFTLPSLCLVFLTFFIFFGICIFGLCICILAINFHPIVIVHVRPVLL